MLTKLDVRFKPDSFNPAGFWHSYGWKKKLGTGEAKRRSITPDKARDAYLKSGYTLVE